MHKRKHPKGISLPEAILILRLDDDIKQKIRTLLQSGKCSDYFCLVRMFITKHLGYKIDSDPKHIPIRTFDYEATKSKGI